MDDYAGQCSVCSINKAVKTNADVHHGATTCRPILCREGYVISKDGEQCVPCPDGFEEVSGVCKPCPVGYISEAGGMCDTTCEAGMQANEVQCDPCPRGTYHDGSGTGLFADHMCHECKIAKISQTTADLQTGATECRIPDDEDLDVCGEGYQACQSTAAAAAAAAADVHIYIIIDLF